jgi:pimeloyl-ACP methyl ester carboxylesterase
VGRLSREKRVDVLVRALSFLPEWTLTIVGSGPRSAALRRAARRFAPGRVKFAGDLSDDLLAAEYAAADLFCMPSPAEFECVAALEALNFGLPLVVPRAGALTEIADEEAVAAYADPDDAEALAACVTGLHPDRIERSGIAAAARHLAADRPLHRTLDLWVDAYTVDQPTPPRSSLGKPATAPWTATQIIRTRGGAHVRTWLAGPESARDTLILLHGIAVNSDTCWRAVVPLLPKGCRIVALDFYGHGSDRPCGADLSIAGYAVAALDTLDALGVRQATIVGHSLGGTVAQVMALRAQERQSPLSGIILSSTASRFADTRLRRAKFAAAAAATPAMAAAPECAQIQAGRMFARLKCFDTRDGFRANEYNWPQVMRVGQELCLFDSRPWVNMLSLPCFAIVTVHDRVVPVSIQQDLVGRLNWRGFIETPMEHDASMTSAGNYAAAVRVGLEWLRDAHRQARGVP